MLWANSFAYLPAGRFSALCANEFAPIDKSHHPVYPVDSCPTAFSRIKPHQSLGLCSVPVRRSRPVHRIEMYTRARSHAAKCDAPVSGGIPGQAEGGDGPGSTPDRASLEDSHGRHRFVKAQAMNNPRNVRDARSRTASATGCRQPERGWPGRQIHLERPSVALSGWKSTFPWDASPHSILHSLGRSRGPATTLLSRQALRQAFRDFFHALHLLRIRGGGCRIPGTHAG